MVSEIEAAVNPDAIFGDGDVFLGVDGPLTGLRNAFALCCCCQLCRWRGN